MGLAIALAAGTGGLLAVDDAGKGRPTDMVSRLLTPTEPQVTPKSPHVGYVARAPAPLSGPPAPAVPVTTDLTASFQDLQEITGATIGLVVVPVGKAGPWVQLGSWSTVGPAWSTIKVPLTMAAMRLGTADPALIEATITRSDNVAAERLWVGLGEPVAAATAIEAVMVEAGDPTPVESERVRSEYSAFGQTSWPLTEQAAFMASVMCNQRFESIITLMGQISPEQRWGLGVLPDSRFKGGWGPSPDGDYLVRQFGTVTSEQGTAAVALQASPESGAFDDGVKALSATARWLGAHSDAVVQGHCS